jgi:hypothetical protein
MAQNCNCHGSGEKHSQTVAGLLERPRYSPGLILEDSDLTSAVEYGRSLTRLMFRNLFGCGVVCGLLVSVKKECGLTVTIAPGLALDGCGDPIEVPRPVEITLDSAEVEALEGKPQGPERAQFWVVLCGKEKMCAPRALVCDSDEFDGAAQPTRIRAHAEVSLVDKRPECVCACRPGTEPVQQDANLALADDEVDCHLDHESRTECAPDCGCGTACACGCCLLLAHVYFGERNAAGQMLWAVRNRGVRRFIRPKLLPDPAERPQGWTSDMATRVVVMGAPAARSGRSAPASGLAGIRRGDVLTQGAIVELIRREEQPIASTPPVAEKGMDETSGADAGTATTAPKKARATPAKPAADEAGVAKGAEQTAKEKK